MATRRPAEESRALLIEAAADVINSEGYAALSARKLAERVGLSRQIVHYYFRTMEELLLAVVRHYGDQGLARLAAAMKEGNPLRAIWDIESDSSATTHAFLAMAKHRPAIRAEIELYYRKFCELQLEAVTGYLASQGKRTQLSPRGAILLVQSISQGLKAEADLGGADSGHAEIRELMEDWLDAGGGSWECETPSEHRNV